MPDSDAIIKLTTKRPKQSRSIASTNRMLDSAEQIFATSGPDGLTVEAVTTMAGTSVGSFYSRFVNRDGLLFAMHERFIQRMDQFIESISEKAASRRTIREAIKVIIKGYYQLMQDNRNSITFFMLFKADDSKLKERGVLANAAAAGKFKRVMKKFESEINHPDPEIAADFAFRFLIAMLVQQIMFQPAEVTGRSCSEAKLIVEISRMMTEYFDIS